MTYVAKADAGANSTEDEMPLVQWLALKSNILSFDLRQHFILRWGKEEGFYLVGPFETSEVAHDWAVENQGISNLWQPVHVDPNRPFPVEPPGTIPEFVPGPYDPDFDDPWRWRPPQGRTGAFHLLMNTVPYFVGPFSGDRDAYGWGMENERRTGEGDWWLVWVDDSTARPRLLTPERGVIEAERYDAEYRFRYGP
jgi:hypothetical protein